MCPRRGLKMKQSESSRHRDTRTRPFNVMQTTIVLIRYLFTISSVVFFEAARV